MDQPVSIPDNWTPPAELSRARPREVRITATGILATVFAIILIAVTIPLFLFMRNESDRAISHTRELRQRGSVATGEVTRLSTEGRHSDHIVEYAFSANGVRYHGESNVPDSLWKQVQMAGMIPIRYLPDAPGLNHPADWDETSPPQWLCYAVPVIVAFSAAFLYFSLRRQAGLLAEGIPAAGVVTNCRRVKGGYMARYAFRMQGGENAAGRSKVRRRYEIGQPVTIVYHPEKTSRNRIYPFDSYRVV